MNVLLTSVGRRAYMVKYFKEVLGKIGSVHVSNSDDKTVAFQYADKSVVTPLIYDENYISFLIEYCKNNHIDFLISLFDIDLLVLAKNKQKFEEIGTRLIVSDVNIIEICNDKWKTYEFLLDNGFNVPKSYLKLEDTKKAIESGEISYPIIIKPRFGCGSIGVLIAENDADLEYCYNKTSEKIRETYLKYESVSVSDKIIFQQMLNGQEYGADVINDLNGNFKNAVIKKKIAMRAGETDIAELVKMPKIYSCLSRLSSITKHIANMDCDVFLVDDVPYILEMNARFGGGYPFSHMGGCNLPLAIAKWLSNEDVSEEILSAKVGFIGYKEIYITKI